MNKKSKLKENLILALVGIIGAFAGMLFFCISSYWAHEMGHLAASFVLGWWYTDSLPYISNWTSCPILGISVPQQTSSIPSPPVALAGPVANLAFVFVALYITSKKLKFPFIWGLPIFILFFLFEAVGNVLCETDNWKGKALINCSSFKVDFLRVVWLSIIVCFIFLSMAVYANGIKKRKIHNPYKL